MYLGIDTIIFIAVTILYTALGYWDIKRNARISSMFYRHSYIIDKFFSGFLAIGLAGIICGMSYICKEFDINNLRAILDDVVTVIVVPFVCLVGSVLLTLLIQLETSNKRKEDSATGILSEIEIRKAGFDTSLSGDWQKVAEHPLTQEEKSCVHRAEIIDSKDGPTCCFFLTTGQRAHYPIAASSVLKVGDEVDLDKVKIITLYRFGGQIKRLE